MQSIRRSVVRVGHENPIHEAGTDLDLIWKSILSWIDSAERWQPLSTMCFSIRWPWSAIFHGLTLCGWVAVVSQLEKLSLFYHYHSTTLDSVRSWKWPIHSQMFREAVCMPRCLIFYTCGHEGHSGIWTGKWILLVIYCIFKSLHFSLCVCLTHNPHLSLLHFACFRISLMLDSQIGQKEVPVSARIAEMQGC